jgi:hypothetical protein
LVSVQTTKEGCQHYSQDIQRILGKHEKVFGKIPPGKPPDRGFEHTIELEEGAKPIITTPYRHPKVEGYLNNYVARYQRDWVKWLHLGEYFYNTTHHKSIGMTHFRALYGYYSLTFMEIVLGDNRAPMDKDWIQESQEILEELKDHLQRSQNQQNLYAGKNRVERSFGVGDLVYLRLYPYRKISIKINGVENIKPRFYGPYRMDRRVGEVAYEIEFPRGSKIHNVFHLSCLNVRSPSI